jgi:glycine oxidase
MAKIHVLGAGIVGICQALILQRRGNQVTLWDPAGIPSRASASRLAGAMLGPFCEAEAGHEIIRELGIASLPIWRGLYAGAEFSGSLVTATARDQADLRRFAAVTSGHRWLGADEIDQLEPALAGRFPAALFYSEEGHMDPEAALAALAGDLVREGVELREEAPGSSENLGDWVVDCRGIAARDELKTLRGVRGERVIIECPEVRLERAIRLLHPRTPLYIVPWGRGRFMVGATLIESEDKGEPTVRSILELLGGAYALLPELGEARILDIAANIRPAFPDNLPKIIVRGRRIFVNGLYRHGFLLSPILARLTADYIEQGLRRDGVVFEDHGEW